LQYSICGVDSSFRSEFLKLRRWSLGLRRWTGSRTRQGEPGEKIADFRFHIFGFRGACRLFNGVALPKSQIANRKSTIENLIMPVRYGRFEMPKTLVKDENTATETYAKFVAEPFEAGYGHTVGNSLRRVLLSSLEGAAITAVKITGAQHEFATLPGVVEDVTDIVLNLKKVKFKAEDHEPRKLSLTVNKEGAVTAGDIQLVQGYDVLNPKQVICTLDKKHKLDAELEVRVGRGFATGEENKRADQPIGLIPIDSIFSPVTRVKYAVENTRVGQRTDYDKLILEIWTDRRLTPDDALLQASAILRHHLDVFVHFNEDVIEFDETPAGVSEENIKLKKLLNMSVNEIELSVRAANCLNNANITTVGQLAQKTEAEMLKYRNFGKKSLNEIKDKLQHLGLSLGMKFDPGLVDVPASGDGASPDGAAAEEKTSLHRQSHSPNHEAPKKDR
jgi:DNA-directed RNA polymerase subunit alpha